jgi:excisionase family DNA binding protein
MSTKSNLSTLIERLQTPPELTSIAKTPAMKNVIEIEIPKPRVAIPDDDDIDEFQMLANVIRQEFGAFKRHAKKAKPLRLMVSHREAARLLGIDRGTTLKALIEAGQIRTVQANGRVRIPLEEVERIADQGYDLSRSKPKRRKTRSKKAVALDVVDAINKIKL